MATTTLSGILILTTALAAPVEDGAQRQARGQHHATAPSPELEHGFREPPPEARPWVYWWFQGSHGDPEGMARDLAAMWEKGIGGVMHMQTVNAGGLPLPQQPQMLSDDWSAWFGKALGLARETGMTMSASIIDGWGHGGWWVGEEDGAKQLVHTEVQVQGPAPAPVRLPQPLTRLGIYRDVAVVAFREHTPRPPAPLRVTADNVQGGYCGEENWPAAHAADGDPATFWRTQSPCSAEAPARLTFEFDRPLRAVAAFVAGMPGAGPAEAEIQASQDGTDFEPVVRLALEPGEARSVPFDRSVDAGHFRLVVYRSHAPDLQLAEFTVLRQGDEPMWRHGVKWWDYKSGNRAWWGWPPDPYAALEDRYDEVQSPDRDLNAEDVLDLTPHVQADGQLAWEVPEGRWTIMRFGWTPLAEPARMGSGGYEVDVLDPKGADLMMDSAARRMRELSLEHADGAPIVFHTDSWEIGAGGKGQQPTWTEGFREAFRERRGYDLLPYLPALARRLVDSRDGTDRFLRDYRATIADLLAAYYARLQERAHEMNGAVNCESGYGSYPHPHLDGLQVFGRSDRPMAEFWHPFGQYSSVYLEHVDIMRTAASAARIYGRPFVQAETLTYNPTAGLFTPPAEYRRTLHEAWARGLNQAVIHKYTHQPEEEKPGMLDYDIFNRHFSWWPLADGFLGYMGRCQYLLQQGVFAADALFFVGEGASRFVPGKGFLRPALPSGYDYDGLNAEVLLTRLTVQDRQLTLPNGLRYRYLVLCEPQCRTLSLPVLRRITELVEAGATLVGTPPESLPGLGHSEEHGVEFAELRAGLWGRTPETAGERTFGQGRVLWGRTMEQILEADALPPDLEILPEAQDGPQRAGLAGADWIWHAGDPAVPMPGERLFRAVIEVPPDRTVVRAMASMTADNRFALWINGREGCRGDEWSEVVDAEITDLLNPGANQVLVHAANGGDGPNPAGLIGKLLVLLDNGQRLELQTDATSWLTSDGSDRWQTPRVVGPLGVGPWGEIEEGETRLEWLHRRTADAEVYFLSNPLNRNVSLVVALRAQGKRVRLFDPLDGTATELSETRVTTDGRTVVRLRFAPQQALFVVMSDKGGDRDPLTESEAVTLGPVLPLDGPWEVSFDADWVRPLPETQKTATEEVSLVFPTLTDWSEHPEQGIRAYSGTATYRKSFDLPVTDVALSTAPAYLTLGTVKGMARVTLNDQDLGVAWCPPWRVRIPKGLLKAEGNRLVITVANGWQNRLCADHALPENERLTRVGHNLHAQAAHNGYQPAGLLGPVVLSVNRTGDGR